MDTLIGKSLQGRQYTLTELLGQGGFGVTFKATHHFLEEICVVKTLNPEFRDDPQFPTLVQKFRDEAKRLKLCEHPNIVRMRDFFVEDDVPYLVMDYIPGRSLEQVVFPNQPLSEAEAIHYVQQIGSALALVHQKGLLHRDLKPENIILHQQTNQAMLIDFGIAREFSPGKTQAHTNLVTVGYAPVEQYMLKAKRTPATDVYGLAATLYALVTARVPVASIMRDRQPMPEPRTLNPRLSPGLNQAILRGMAMDVEQRPATIEAWISLLPSSYAAPPVASAARSPSTAPTVAISPPPPVAPAAAPVAPRHSPAPAAKIPVASTAATLAASPASPDRPPRTAATVAPIPAPAPPVPPVRRSSGRGLILLGLVSLVSMSIAAVATVLYHASQVAPFAEESTSGEVVEVPEAPIEPEITATPSETPEASPAPGQTESPAIALPDLPDIFGKSEPEQEQNQEQQPEASDRPAPDPPQPPEAQLPTNATIRSVPGFSPGTRERQVVSRLGEPGEVRNDNGLRTAVYVFPQQVDLVYIYNAQDRLQQSEAYFAPYMDFNVMRIALNGMLENRLTAEIEQGLEAVRRGEANSVPIATEQFQGVIENTGDRIYVGVWEK